MSAPVSPFPKRCTPEPMRRAAAVDEPRESIFAAIRNSKETDIGLPPLWPFADRFSPMGFHMPFIPPAFVAAIATLYATRADEAGP